MRCEIGLAAATAPLTLVATMAQAATADWPSYNRTLTSDRYASLEAIDNKNVAGLKILCTFDTGQQTSFQTGLVKPKTPKPTTTHHHTTPTYPKNPKHKLPTHKQPPSG